MERYVDLKDISDGKLYTENDMVKAEACGCRDCSYCCEHMADTILLDPLDIFRLEERLSEDFNTLLQHAVELNVHDGLILPNLKLSGNGGRCGFLNEEGWCSIHTSRPGFCRLFPLGRYYENGDFTYFLQVHECPVPGKNKVKVKKWIDTPRLAENRRFINQWHDLQSELINRIRDDESGSIARNLNLTFLNLFFVTGYDTRGDFYSQFEERLNRFRQLLF